MANYTFSVKKGKYILSLMTEDREFLSSQFELWVRQSSEYARRRKATMHIDSANAQIKKEEEITKQKIEAQIKRKAPEPSPEEEIPQFEELPEKKEPENDLDIFYAPVDKESPVEADSAPNVNVTAPSEPKGVFDEILEDSIKTPQEEMNVKVTPSIKKDDAYINYIGGRKVEKKIDYLLLTAYYFTQYEQKPRFTLKQLNAKLMQNLAVIIDHAVLQEAINRDYIECLPDLTGLVGASEYRLTAYGEKTLLES